MLSSSFLQELNPFSSCSFVGIKHTPRRRLPGLPSLTPLPPPFSLPASNCSLFHCTNMPFKITHSSKLLVTTSASLPQKQLSNHQSSWSG